MKAPGGGLRRPGTPDPRLVEGFVAGTLDPKEEAALADEVARLLPLHWRLPNPMVAALSRLTKHLGGEAELLGWLDQHPGTPRLVARLYVLIDVLDQYSGVRAVVSALAEFRALVPDPPALAGYIVPETTSATLASLGTEIELLLADGQTGTAVRVAEATAELLERAALRAAERDPENELAGLIERCERVRRQIAAAADG